MRRLTFSNKEQGFTLVELIISLPLVTIIVVVLVSALFTQYTNTLAESARTSLRASGQTILINLQDELLFTIAYSEGLEARLNDPYEPTGGWTYDTDPQTLIINEIAIDSTRRDEDRHIVRQRVNNCETSSVTANPLAINNVFYFVEPNPNSPYSTLYKRTVVPDYNLCSIDAVTGDPCTPTTTACRGIAKETTCPEAFVGIGTCTSRDSPLTENVLDFQIKYFSEGNVETAIPSAADKIEIELTLGDKVFGKEVKADVKHTIRKIN
jgi:type II secretory pathway pseudopilin PulG